MQFVTKPSQKSGNNRFLFLDKMTQHLQGIDTDELQCRLGKIDTQLIKEVNYFIKITGLSEEEFNASFATKNADETEKSISALENKLKDFRRKAQTNVAIRITLLGRGVQLLSIKLPVTQEHLSSQVADLKTKEKKCKTRIKQEINILLDDTNKILNNEQYPEALKNKMVEVKEQLESALTHIEHGKNIEDLPMIIEVHEDQYELPVGFGDDKPQQSPDKKAESDTPPVECPAPKDALKAHKTPATNTPHTTEKNKSLFYLLKCWLLSPWGVTWKEIKRQNMQD